MGHFQMAHITLIDFAQPPEVWGKTPTFLIVFAVNHAIFIKKSYCLCTLKV